MSLFLSTLMVCYEQVPTSHYRVQKKREPNGLPFSVLRYCSFPSFPLAEREGFEPPEPLGSTVFKTAALDHSAIFPPLTRSGNIYAFSKASAKVQQISDLCKFFFIFLFFCFLCCFRSLDRFSFNSHHRLRLNLLLLSTRINLHNKAFIVINDDGGER